MVWGASQSLSSAITPNRAPDGLELEVWRFSGAWCLEFGAFSAEELSRCAKRKTSALLGAAYVKASVTQRRSAPAFACDDFGSCELLISFGRGFHQHNFAGIGQR